MRTPIDWRELYAANRAVIEGAGAGRSVPPGPSAPSVPPAPGETRDATTIIAGETRRHALVHVPPGLAPGAAVPLVCMLHGCTQDAASFAAATRMNDAADRHGFVVVYPQQERGENQGRCWNWFEPRHQARGAGEPASIAAIVRELVGTASPHAVDPARVFVVGLSAGGAMAAVLAATYPEVFAAVAVHSGLAYGAATSMGAAVTAMGRGTGDAAARGRAAHAAMGCLARPVPSIVIHGAADRTVARVNAREVLEQSMTANRLASPQTQELDVARPTSTVGDQVDGGHAFTRARWITRDGALMHELITVDGLGHAWSGGAPGGSFTDPRGPDATEAILGFFARATA